ncbi:MAG: hypothetical protein LUQ64_00645 [Methanomicrobiales archaeon]|nr:hypothetical protein [Methanomicrobiales archaeon]
MAKARRVPVRSFGSEVMIPAVGELAEWVREQRGSSADLTTFLLDRSLSVQEGVDIPCAGGLCYGDRWRSSLHGIRDRVLVHDPDPSTGEVEGDALGIVAARKGAWVGIPAPHLLEVRDGYFRDPEEFCAAICGAYRELMRAMRDRGIRGHVILADTPDGCELEFLAQSRTYYLARDPGVGDLEAILEHQSRIAIAPALLPEVVALQDQYRIRSIALLDPAPEDLAAASESMDAGRIETGGYCTGDCGVYWDALVKRSLIPASPPPGPAGGSGGFRPGGRTGSGPPG